jgi:predicted PurR-regulated permease PerM
MVWGMLIIALADGVVAGIILAILGVSNSLLYAVLVAGFSFIPLLGTGMVVLPIAAYLLINGEIIKAIILAIFQVVVIGNIDTVLRAKLVPREVSMPLVISFIAILGGVAMFGIWGLIYGPVIFSLLLAIIEITRTHYFPQPPSDAKEPVSKENEIEPDTDQKTETLEESTD